LQLWIASSQPLRDDLKKFLATTKKKLRFEKTDKKSTGNK